MVKLKTANGQTENCKNGQTENCKNGYAYRRRARGGERGEGVCFYHSSRPQLSLSLSLSLCLSLSLSLSIYIYIIVGACLNSSSCRKCDSQSRSATCASGPGRARPARRRARPARRRARPARQEARHGPPGRAGPIRVGPSESVRPSRSVRVGQSGRLVKELVTAPLLPCPAGSAAAGSRAAPLRRFQRAGSE